MSFVVNYVCLFVCLFVLAITTFVLGKRLGCLEEQMPPDCKVLIDSLQEMLVATQDLLFNLPLHKIWSTKNWKKLVENTDRVCKVPMAHIKEKLAEIKKDDAELIAKGEEVPMGVDFITYMVHQGKMDLKKITSNAVDLIGGGVDSVSCMLACTMKRDCVCMCVCLIFHPHNSLRLRTPCHGASIHWPLTQRFKISYEVKCSRLWALRR